MYSKLSAKPGETPTKVVFDGVEPGSAAAQQLFHENQGEIQHFHKKARQSRELGELPQAGMQQALEGGGRMSYSYNNGQEILRVRIEPTPPPPVPRPVVLPKGERWDYALIELVLPDMDKTAAVFSAFVRDRQTDAGVARDDGGGQSYDPKPQLEYGSATYPVTTTINGEAEQVSSLRVDLSSFYAPVKIDIYGYIRVYYDDGPRDVVDSTMAVLVGRELVDRSKPFGKGRLGGLAGYSVNGKTWAQNREMFAELYDFQELPPARVYVDFLQYATYYGPPWSGGVSGTSVLSEFGIYRNFTVENSGEVTFWDEGKQVVRSNISFGSTWNSFSDPLTLGPDVNPSSEANFVTLIGFALGAFYEPIYATSQEPQFIKRTAQLRSVLMKGKLLDRVARHDTDKTAKHFFTWESKGYPDRLGMNVDKTAAPVLESMKPPNDTSLDNHFGMPLLGTVEIDPVLGTVGWTPA